MGIAYVEYDDTKTDTNQMKTALAGADYDISHVAHKPICKAGPDLNAIEGDAVTLDGSGSFDADNDELVYEWAQVGGTNVVLSDTSSLRSTFTAPDVPEEGESLVFELTATDTQDNISTDRVAVRVADLSVPETVHTDVDPAGAKALIDSSEQLTIVDVREPDEYCTGYIAGSLNYPWNSGVFEQKYTDLPVDDNVLVVCGSGYRSDKASSFLDSKGYSAVYDMTGGMSVWTFGKEECPDTYPVAVAGDDKAVYEGETVTLDGLNSYDPATSILSYKWTQTEGPAVVLTNDSEVGPSFVALAVTNPVGLKFELTVKNANDLTHSDEVVITVNDNGINIFPDNVITFKTSSGKDMGLLVNSGSLVGLSVIDGGTTSGDKPDDLLYGLIDLKLKVDNLGDTANITIHLPESAPANYKWYKHGQDSTWSDFGDKASFNAERNRIDISVADGDDGVVDGWIMNKSGLGNKSTVTPNTDDDDGSSGGCFISTSGSFF